MRRIRSGGVGATTEAPSPNAARIAADTGIDLAVRGQTPPPSLINARS